MKGAGRVVFAAIMLLVVGTINIIYGFGALDNANIFLNDTRFVLSDLNTLGWVLIVLGLIQLTGRDNYSDAGVELGQPYLEQPDLVAQPEHAALTAAWYWHTRKCNLLADSAQWDAITRVINGAGMLHATERRVMTDEALRAFA